jgi:hypothetical protein
VITNQFERVWPLCEAVADERADNEREWISMTLDEGITEMYADSERDRFLAALDEAARTLAGWVAPFAAVDAIAAATTDFARASLGEITLGREVILPVMPYDDYLQTHEWAARRVEALRRADDRCQVCDGNESLSVHHRTYERRGRERPDDLTVLCGPCHELFHRSRQLSRG